MESIGHVASVIEAVIAKDPTIMFAYLFGSVAKGTAHANSDVDVAVYYASDAEAGTANEDLVDRQILLGLELERELKLPADVVVLNHASVDLRQNVLRHGYLLFSRDPKTLSAFKRAHLHQHQDYIMLEPIFRRYRQRRIEEGWFGGRSVNGAEAPGHH